MDQGTIVILIAIAVTVIPIALYILYERRDAHLASASESEPQKPPSSPVNPVICSDGLPAQLWTSDTVGKVQFQWFPKSRSPVLNYLPVFLVLAGCIFFIEFYHFIEGAKSFFLITCIISFYIYSYVTKKKYGLKYFLTERGVFTSSTNDNHEMDTYPQVVFEANELQGVLAKDQNTIQCIIQRTEQSYNEKNAGRTPLQTIGLRFQSREDASTAENILRLLMSEGCDFDEEDSDIDNEQPSVKEQYLSPRFSGKIGRDFYNIRAECPRCGKRIRPKPRINVACSCGHHYSQTTAQFLVGLTWAWPYAAVVCFAVVFIYCAIQEGVNGDTIGTAALSAIGASGFWSICCSFIMFLYDLSIGIQKILSHFKSPEN